MFSEDQKFFLFSQNTEAPIMYSFPVAAITKVSQTSLFKTTEMYSLTLLEAGSPKSRCQQRHALSEGSRGDCPMPFS